MAIGAGCVALATTTQTRAAVQFAFASSLTNVEVQSGQTAEVTIYLVETVTDGSASVLAAENGLEFAQVAVAREQADGASIASYALNPAFDDSPFITTTPAVAPYTALDVAQALSTGASAGVNGAAVGGVTRVPLLTLTVTAAPTAGTTSFSLTDTPNFSETLTFANNVVLDNLITSGVFTVTTVVPEPGTLSTLAVVGAIVGRRRR